MGQDTKKHTVQLETSLQYVKGVGPKLAELFKKQSLLTVKDLIHRLPRSYQDNRVLGSLSELSPQQSVIVKADVVKKSIIPLRGGHKKIYEIIISDGLLNISCKFFRIPYKNWFNSLRVGEKVELRGKAVFYKNRLEFHHPQIFPADPEETHLPEKDLISPLYSEIENISQHKIRGILKSIFKSLKPQQQDLEWLPPWLLKKYNLPPLFKALKAVHCPNAQHINSYLNFKTEFQKRLIFDEFFELQFYFALKKQGWKMGQAPSISLNPELMSFAIQKLPFKLTSAQQKVLKMILKDFNSTQPMHRLIQGDVGCGKTVLALMAALVCAKKGFQTAIMVPTEILAQQHYKNARQFLEPFGIKVELLTGKMKPSQKRTIKGVLNSGFCQVCIGTHALIQENIEFHKLAFVVVDEQHRFGSHQRALLKSKGADPHFLVMTATPIPRTLSLAIYGDLDVSVIDEMPPGRIPVVTRRSFPSQRKKVFDFLKDQVKTGRQAYVIYPLVEESEALDLKNATHQYEKLKAYYKDLNWGLLTGRMHSNEKQDIMNRFIEGKIQVLVSTTVIEVGVDVANANLIVIEHAERFGLSQLHQLRGRVGRGPYKSYCVVVLGERFSKEAGERALIMQKFSDGFKIAEKDLEIRGPGEFLGSRQSGLPGFKIAHLIRDADILSLAKKAAFDLVSQDPNLKNKDHQKIKQRFKDLSLSIRPG